MSLSIDLRAERVNRGLSLAAAADRMGVTPDTLARAERGVGLHPRNAYAIARFYGYQVTDVWPLDPEPSEKAA